MIIDFIKNKIEEINSLKKEGKENEKYKKNI